MTSAFRLDEGFSEDTKSQAGSEMPPRPDSRMGGTTDQEPADPQLPDWIMGMSEWERSGTPSAMFISCLRLTNQRSRVRLLPAPIIAYLVHRRYC